MCAEDTLTPLNNAFARVGNSTPESGLNAQDSSIPANEQFVVGETSTSLDKRTPHMACLLDAIQGKAIGNSNLNSNLIIPNDVTVVPEDAIYKLLCATLEANHSLARLALDNRNEAYSLERRLKNTEASSVSKAETTSFKARAEQTEQESADLRNSYDRISGEKVVLESRLRDFEKKAASAEENAQMRIDTCEKPSFNLKKQIESHLSDNIVQASQLNKLLLEKHALESYVF